MKKLPIGIQSFKDLRNKDFLYVDKTKEIFELVTTSGKSFFLSRPRRFGKSLLISTLEELFKGNKPLFENLFIYDKWDWTQQYPVIRLDFGGCSSDNPEILRSSLYSFMNNIAKRYDITLNNPELTDRFCELIEQVHNVTGRQVVALVDEYDKPIADHLSNLDVADANREVLRGFYRALKASDEHLRFIFMTGVSKFAKVSVFSELNNLKDITMHARYATICGYTQTELESYFGEYINSLASVQQSSVSETIEHIRRWYDGYSWDGVTSVYNPFSVLLLFDENEFENYWFETGTPTFLINLIKERNDIRTVLEPITVGSTAFMGFDIRRIGLASILFQTGYLTVKSKKTAPDKLTKLYTLGIPNEEVNDSFLFFLVSSYTNYPVDETPTIKDLMKQQILTGDSEGFTQSLRTLLANIPYILHVDNERYYHSLFLAWMKMLGFDIHSEVMTNIGRIDAVWHQPNLTVVAEIKYHATTKIDNLLNDAMKQINKRKYFEKYSENKIMLLAIAFSGQEVKCRIIPHAPSKGV